MAHELIDKNRGEKRKEEERLGPPQKQGLRSDLREEGAERRK